MLVLGGTGFTGRALVEELAARGRRVVAPGRAALDLRETRGERPARERSSSRQAW